MFRDCARSAVFVLASTACSSFGGAKEDPPAPAGPAVEAPALSRPSDGGPGGAACASQAFIDDFERESVIGSWSEGVTSLGDTDTIALTTSTRQRARGSRSLMSVVLSSGEPHAQYLKHTLVAAGPTPKCLDVSFELLVEALPSSRITFQTIDLASSSSLSLGLSADGIEVVEKTSSPDAGTSSNRLSAYPIPVLAWTTVRVHFEEGDIRAKMTLQIGADSYEVPPLKFQHRGPERLSVGIVHAEGTASSSFYIDEMSIR